MFFFQFCDLDAMHAAVAFRDTVDWSAGKYGLGEEVKLASKRKYHVGQSVSKGMVLQKNTAVQC